MTEGLREAAQRFWIEERDVAPAQPDRALMSEHVELLVHALAAHPEHGRELCLRDAKPDPV